MKNIFRITLAAIAASVMLVGCESNGSKATADSVSIDSNTSVQTNIDTTYQVDSNEVDTSLNADVNQTPATVTDTVAKTVTKKTVVKKSVTKKQQ